MATTTTASGTPAKPPRTRRTRADEVVAEVATGATMPEVYVAKATGVVRIKGKVYRYIAGKTRVGPQHPLVRQMPERFTRLAIDFEEG